MKAKWIVICLLVSCQPDGNGTKQENDMETTQPTIESLAKQREFFDGLGKIYDADTTVTVEEKRVNDVETYLFTPKQAIEGKLLLYFHGGCYALGSIDSHRAMLSHLSARLQTAILYVEYGLAPEKPFPGGVNDGLKVYQEIVNNEEDIVLMGDSAGGGIVLSLVTDLQKMDIRQPNGVILLSPWIDLRCDNPSYTANAESDEIISSANLEPFVQFYLGENSMEKVNPMDLRFNEFPKNLILVSESEVLLDDSKLLYDKVNNIQPESSLSLYSGQSHVWPLTDINSEASQRVVNEIKEFLNR